MVARRAHNPKVIGSNPIFAIIYIKLFMFLIQLTTNFLLFITGLVGMVINRRNILILIMCIEMMLLSLNLNFIVFSIYFDDLYGQVFSLFILTVAAAESAIGLAIIIIYYRLRGSILMDQISVLKK